MPNDFWRYTTYDGARKRKEELEAQRQVNPLLPPLTVATPKPQNTLPNWLGAAAQPQEPVDTMPNWMNTRAPSAPAVNAPAYGGVQLPAPQAQPAAPATPAQPRDFRWWEQPTEQEVQQWEEYKAQPTYRPASLGEAIGDIGQSVSEGFQQGKAQEGGLLGGIGGAVSGVLSGQNPIGYGARTIGTSLDALTGSMFGTLDSWTQNGLLTADETAQFKQIYASIDPSIHPQIRAAMARESLPRSTKQKILNIVDWTTQNLAKQTSGEFYAGVKGTIEGAKEGYERNGILGAIGGAATGADVGTKDIQGNATGTVRSSIPSYMLNTTLRALAGGPTLAAYGQGVTPDIIRRAVTGEDGGLINPDLYKEIMANREQWKQVENAAPQAYQFVAEMVTDPINVVSTAMGAAAGQMAKQAAREGTIKAETIMARAAQAGLTTADQLADVQKYAKAAGDATRVASMTRQMTPEFRALFGLSQAIDTAQNKGYLASMPGDSAVSMYLAQKTYMRLAPKVLTSLAGKVYKAVKGTPKPDMPAIYKELGRLQYQSAVADAQSMGVKIPDTIYYADRDTNSLKHMPTRDYYVKAVQDAMTTPLDINLGNGKTYSTLGDMVADYVKRDQYTPRDFLDVTQVDRELNDAQVRQFVQQMLVEPDEYTPVPKVLGQEPAKTSIPEQINAARPGSVAGYVPGENMPLNKRYNELVRDELKRRGALNADYNSPTMRNASEKALARLQKEVNNPNLNYGDLDKERQTAKRPPTPAITQPASPLDTLIDSQTSKIASGEEGLQYESREQARQAVEQSVVDDITSNWRTLDEAQAWLDSNDASTEVHLRDDTYVSRDVVQEAINRKRGTAQAEQPAEAKVMEQPALVDYNIRNIRSVVASDARISKILPVTVIDAYEADPSTTNAAAVATGLWGAINSPNATPEVKSKLTNYLDSLNAKHGFEVMGHDGQRVPDTGFVNVKILAFEPHAGLLHDTVIQTTRPSIYKDGKTVQSGEVIVGMPLEQEVVPSEAVAQPAVSQAARTEPGGARIETINASNARVESDLRISRASSIRGADTYWQTNPLIEWSNRPDSAEEYIRTHPRSPTAGYKKIYLDPKALKTIPGDSGEHIRLSRGDTDDMIRIRDIAEDMRANGFKDTGGILIVVEADGSAKVSEGNHRIWAAAEAGLDEIPVEIRYFGGSELTTPYKIEDYAPATRAVTTPIVPPAVSQAVRAETQTTPTEAVAKPAEQPAPRVAEEGSVTGVFASDYEPSGREMANMEYDGQAAIRKATNLQSVIRAGDESIKLYNPITDSEVGTIDLKTERAMAINPKDQVRVDKAFDALRRAAQVKKINMEIDNLRNYPARNAARIAELERLAGLESPVEPAARVEQPIAKAEQPAAATYTRPDGTTIERTIGKPVVARRTASLAGEQSGKTLTVPSHFAVGELDDVQPSHFLSGVRNPEYPAERQPRDYNTASARATVEGGIENPDYRAMVMPSETVDEGPALVTPDGFIVNGTNRRLIAEGISKDPTKWARYQVELRKALPELGIDEAELNKFEKPYLYRVTDEGVPQADILEAAKAISTTKELSTAEAAKEFAKMVDSDRLAGITPGDTPRDTLDNPRNSFFVQEYITRQPPSHRTSLMNAEGKLTDDGVNEIRNATFVAVYGSKGEKMLDKFTSSGEAKMIGDALFNSLFDLAKAESLIKRGERPADLSLADDFLASVDRLMDMRGKKMNLDDYLAQMPMRGFETRPDMTVTQRQLLTLFDQIVKNNRATLRKVMKTYADKVAGAAPQMNMFSNGLTTKSRQQLFTESLVENGVDAANFTFGPRVQEVAPADTPATAPTVDYDKPTYLMSKNNDDTNNLEWGQTVNRDGKAVLKDRAVFSTNDRDWLSYNDRAKRALVKNAVEQSAWGLRSDKAQVIDDIIKATDEWANKLNDIETRVAAGELPTELLQAPEANEPVPGSELMIEHPNRVTPPGGAGGTTPPTPPRTPGAGTMPPPQEPQQPGGRGIGNQLPGMPGVGASQTRPSETRTRTTQANQQATMPTAPGSPPAAAQGGRLLFNPQAKAADVIQHFQDSAPGWVKPNMSKAKRTIVKLARGFVPELGAFETDSIAGAVEGWTLQQARDIAASASDYLRNVFVNMKDAGITITSAKGNKNQMVEGFRLVSQDPQSASKYTPEQIAQLRQMTPNLNDVLSFPDWFEPTTTDAALAARQKAAIMDTIRLIEAMPLELRNDAISRGIPFDNLRTEADNFVPRSLDTKNAIEPLKYSDTGKLREHFTASEGMNRADKPLVYDDVQSTVVTYVRTIAERIAEHETWKTLHEYGGRTLEELVSPDVSANLRTQRGFLENANKTEEVINQLANTVSTPVATHPLVTWMDSELTPADNFAQRVLTMAAETDPATKTQMKKALLGDVSGVAKKYRAAVAEAERALKLEQNNIINLRQGRRGAFGLPGDPNDTVAIDALKRFTGENTLYMEEPNAKSINQWFTPNGGESHIVEWLNNYSMLSRSITQSTDLEMTTRLASMAIYHPRVFAKSVVSAFWKQDTMARWLASPEIVELKNRAQKYGINMDTLTETQDAFSDVKRSGLQDIVFGSKVGKALVALNANPGSMVQLLAFKADWDSIVRAGEARAIRLGDTSPEGKQRAIDFEARGYFKALQDHMGFRSLQGSGTNKMFRLATRTMFMSGRKTVGTVNAQLNWFKGGMQGQEARKLLVGDAIMLTGAAVSLFALNAAVNHKDLEDAETWADFVDPHSPGFLKVNIGGMRVGPGSTVLTLFNYWARLEQAAIEDRDIKKVAAQLPQWWLGRLSPAGSVARTVISGKNFSGVKMITDDTSKTVLNIASEVLGASVPMSLQSIIIPDVYRGNPVAIKTAGGTTANVIGKVAGVVAEWLGGRSTADTPYMLLDKARNAAAQEAFGTKWDNLDVVDKWTLTESVPDLKLLNQLAVENSAGKENAMAMFDLAKTAEYDILLQEAEAARQKFLAGVDADGTPYTGKNYREDLRDIEAKRAAIPAMLKRNNPVYRDVPVTAAEKDAYYAKLQKKPNTVDDFIDAWYQCSQDAIIDEASGAIDFDKLFAARDALTAKTAPIVVAKAMPYINRNKDKSYLAASNAYKRYMALPKYTGLTKKQAALVDEFKAEWNTLRLASVPNAKEVAARKFRNGARMYEATGKQTSAARKRFMFRNGKDSSDGYTRNGTLINLFYSDLALPDLLEVQPGLAASLAI